MTDLAGETAPSDTGRQRQRLRLEFAVLFVAVPILHVIFFETFGPFIPLAAVFIIATIILAFTPGFRWIAFVDVRPLARYLPTLFLTTILCAAVTVGLALLFVPERFLSFPRSSPDRFLLVISLYPFLSVLGQEIAYRLLFFERYRGLFGSDSSAIFASAFIFALAHAFYFNWVAVGLSFAGGLVFAWAYVRSTSFLLVWILHSIAGQVLFASGLGIYFYHGVIPR